MRPPPKRYRTRHTCPVCNGSGIEPGKVNDTGLPIEEIRNCSQIVCRECDGDGEIIPDEPE